MKQTEVSIPICFTTDSSYIKIHMKYGICFDNYKLVKHLGHPTPLK